MRLDHHTDRSGCSLAAAMQIIAMCLSRHYPKVGYTKKRPCTTKLDIVSNPASDAN